MWYHAKIALGSWLITGALIAVGFLFPKGWIRELWFVLPMITGIAAITMSFLGFCEVASGLLGGSSIEGPESIATPEDQPTVHPPATRPRSAA